jgi:hypothetical protein
MPCDELPAPALRSDLGSRKKSFLGSLRKLYDKKIVLRVKIVFTRLIDDTHHSHPVRTAISKRHINLSALERGGVAGVRETDHVT